MSRFRVWMPLVVLFLAIAAVQALLIVELAPDSGETGAVSVENEREDAWSWADIVRDDGPILERIPAPYVVLTLLTGAVVAMVGWYLLVRWTDISEAF